MNKEEVALDEIQKRVRLLSEQLTNEDLETAIELLQEAQIQNRKADKTAREIPDVIMPVKHAVMRTCRLSLRGARIPTLAEYELFSGRIPMCRNTWPLDARGDKLIDVKIVDRFGSVRDKNCTYQMGIRPLIEVSCAEDAGIRVGDKFYIGDFAFTLVTEYSALCDICIAMSAFDLRSPYYCDSLAKRVVDNWYAKQILKR